MEEELLCLVFASCNVEVVVFPVRIRYSSRNRNIRTSPIHYVLGLRERGALVVHDHVVSIRILSDQVSSCAALVPIRIILTAVPKLS